MNIYMAIASSIGTSEAVDLGERLAEWHDAMVMHQRRLRSASGVRCGNRCPHAEARELWPVTFEIFGDRALELNFLVKHGSTSHPPPASSVKSEIDRTPATREA